MILRIPSISNLGTAVLGISGLALSGGILTGCGGGSDSSSGSVDTGSDGVNGLQIVSCSLGCIGSGDNGFSCTINQVFVNQEISIVFNEPVNPDSINQLSFRVVSETGSTPSGEYAVDPFNNRRVIFRPLVTFGSDGLPDFGLDSQLTYTVEIPAFDPDSLGFYITSVSGQPNVTPLECTVLPNLGVDDVVPGNPEVAVEIEFIDPVSSELTQLNAFTSPDGVPAQSRLRFTFNDVMNPATLVNTVTNTSDFIEVRIDLDGDLTDASDQLPIQGSFTLDINQGLTEQKSTVVEFVPGQGGTPGSNVFPKAGDPGLPPMLNPNYPRRIVVVLPPTITDLGGQPLANAGEVTFTTEDSVSAEEDLQATFVDQEPSLDESRSSLVRDIGFQDFGVGTEPIFEGRLLRGLGGGSGRLGDLTIAGQQVVTISTGPTVPTIFGPDLVTGPVVDDQGTVDTSDDVVTAYNVRTEVLDNYDPNWNIPDALEDPPNTLPLDADEIAPGEAQLTITDGVFEFASLSIAAGGRLAIVGENPGRIFVRGNADVRGAIESTGADADAHDPRIVFGGDGGESGPSGGNGGKGGDRSVISGSPFDAPVLAAGLVPHGVGAIIDVDGQPGEGRNGLAPGVTDFGAGAGGDHFPPILPGPNVDDLNDFEDNNLCTSSQVGVPGLGASFAIEGGIPTYGTPNTQLGIPVSPVFPLPSSDLLRAFEANLDPDNGGELVGGAGGGGGGMGIAFTRTSGTPFNCTQPLLGPTLQVLTFSDASGAGGGGGGGSLQVQVGRELTLEGSIALGGGDGGDLVSSPTVTFGSMTAPGGGGSGGSLLLQAFELSIANFPGVIDVRGGEGGINLANASRGGDGAPGIVQMENSAYLAGGGLPPTVLVDDAITLESEGTKIAPTLGGDIATADVLAVGNFITASSGVGATVGFQSCWLVPSPGVFEANFQPDDFDGEGTLGWDLQLEVGGALIGGTDTAVVSYRGDPGPLGIITGGVSVAEFLENELDSSEVVVRVQGARFLSDISDPCLVDLESQVSPILLGSVTPWLRSPDELNTYWEGVDGVSAGLANQRKPNMIRFQILIDGDLPLASAIISVVEVIVRTETS